MATSNEYKDYVLQQLESLDGDITCKKMMGEFLLYFNGTLFGGIYDNRFLVKIVNQNKKYNMEEQIPYVNAKPMYLVAELDDKDIVRKIVIDTCKGINLWKKN